MIMNLCTEPDLLKIMLVLNNFLTVAKVLLPLIIIVMTSFDVFKVIMAGEANTLKSQLGKFGNRLLAAVIVFFIPTVINVVFGFVDTNVVTFVNCYTNVTREDVASAYIAKSELTLTEAEQTLDYLDYDIAKNYISGIENESIRAQYENRLEILSKSIKDRKKNVNIITYEESKNTSVTGSGSLNVVGAYSSLGNGKAQPGIEQKSEPDPSAALNYWSSYVNSKNFTYPKDPTTGLPLGAWPTNYSSISTQLTNYKTYNNGSLIIPTTPENGTYNFVYSHNGIDIMATMGTPVYSPVSGTLMYSEWGHTKNKGGDETAYTVSVKLDKPFTANGKTIGVVFLTHMCGIRYRCTTSTCNNQKIKMGELVGFTGNAVGTSESIGWAPHLHMTLYPTGDYDAGLITESIELLYGLSSGMSIKAGG